MTKAQHLPSQTASFQELQNALAIALADAATAKAQAQQSEAERARLAEDLSAMTNAYMQLFVHITTAYV